MGQKIRKIIEDVGALGMLSIILVIVVISMFLGGDYTDNISKGTTHTLEEKHREQINTLFDSIEGVSIESVNLSYKTVSDSSSTSLFTSSQTNTVSNGVVIIYSGIIKSPYDVTNAISLLIDVPIHQISLLKASELGGN